MIYHRAHGDHREINKKTIMKVRKHEKDIID